MVANSKNGLNQFEPPRPGILTNQHGLLNSNDLPLVHGGTGVAESMVCDDLSAILRENAWAKMIEMVDMAFMK